MRVALGIIGGMLAIGKEIRYSLAAILAAHWDDFVTSCAARAKDPSRLLAIKRKLETARRKFKQRYGL